MQRKRKEPRRKGLYAVAVGTALFLAGLFVTVWSWGVASALGIPLMLVGIIFPFVETYLGGHELGRKRPIKQVSRYQSDPAPRFERSLGDS